MGVVSKLAGDLPEGYGYVVMVGCVANTFVNTWMAINVGRARRRLNVPYPIMYSDSSKEFNCIQRAHQNTLEGQTGFLLLLFVSGLRYPKFSAGVGGFYLLTRVMYALGYYTGEPKNRRYGGLLGFLAYDALLVGAAAFGAEQLGWL